MTEAFSDEQPVTQVRISRSVDLGKYEVTQGQWEVVMGSNPSFFDALEAKMGTTRKTITVTEQQDKWIKAQIDGGYFTNDSEYIAI